MKKQNFLLVILTSAVVFLSLQWLAGGINLNRLSQEVIAAPLAATATPAPEAEASPEADAAPEMAAEAAPEPAEWAEGKSLLVNITSDELDRAAMAISFAERMLKEQGMPVTIFLNVEGVRLADKNIPQNVHVSGQTLQAMLQTFIADGGTVLVCPMCMKNVGGMTEADLIDGAVVSSPDLIGSALFADNVRVLSY